MTCLLDEGLDGPGIKSHTYLLGSYAKKKARQNIDLQTLLVKHYNDLLDRQSSEQGKDEVTYFYVGDVFCIHLGTKYADFQEKILAEISGKKFQTLGIT